MAGHDVSSAHTDITDRKRSKILASDQRRVLESISKGEASQREVFVAITEIAEAHCPNVRASILLLEGKKIRLGAAPSMPDSYSDLIDGLEIGPSVGSCGTAMFCKKRVIVEDVRENPLWGGISHLGEECGFRACWSEPILSARGEILGTFSLYHDEVGKPGSAEVYLIESMSHLAGITIERKQAGQRIRMLSQTVEQSPGSVIVTDMDGDIEYVNPSFERHTGYRADEVIGHNPRLLNSGLTPGHRCEELWQAITQGKSWQGEFQNKKKNGDLIWEYAHIAPVVDEEGIPRHYLSVHEDITLRKKQEEKLLHQAHFDILTGLPNRFLALDRLAQLLKDAKRNKNQVAVLFLDLDDFKKVNDALGHEMGDKLLIQAGSRLSLVARSGDTVGRLGGDEFIVLLSGLSDSGDTRLVVQNLLKQFRAPFEIDGRELILTTSVGVAIFPGDGKNASELLRRADSAMYHAKKLGRNTSAYYTDAMNQEVSRRLFLEEQMCGALNRNEFTVFYQPMIEVDSGAVVGAEALLRWHNPALGNVSPDEFIPVAEQSGLILQIGQFVLTTALDMCARLFPSDVGKYHMAVNLSPRQFREPGLLDFIETALDQAGIPGACLELEITEGVLMSGHSYVTEALLALSELGVGLSMDDFGTGYSSLSYLRNYPFDVVKIDRSFVNDITDNPSGRALINATIAMAHALNLKVVAEGVETAEQLAYLKEQQGCDIAQGYFFAKPMPEAELFEWVTKANKGD